MDWSNYNLTLSPETYNILGGTVEIITLDTPSGGDDFMT